MRSSMVTLLLAGAMIYTGPGRAHGAAGESIQWRNDFRMAALEAKDASKPLLLEFSTDWCGYCKKMKRETFSNRKVIDQVQQCFVPVTIDGDIHKALAEQMGVRSYPTTVIVSPQMRIVAKIAGFRTADELSVDLTKVCMRSHPESPAETLVAQRPGSSSVFQAYCPVTAILDGKFVLGKPTKIFSHRGFQLRFRSDAHRQAFQKHPERYWPVADGRCVVSALDEGIERWGSLQHGLTYRGGIWLFASQAQRERFRTSPDAYFEQLIELSRRRTSVTTETVTKLDRRH